MEVTDAWNAYTAAHAEVVAKDDAGDFGGLDPVQPLLGLSLELRVLDEHRQDGDHPQALDVQASVGPCSSLIAEPC